MYAQTKVQEKRKNQAEGLPRGLELGFLTRPAKKFARAWLCALSSPPGWNGVSFFWVRTASRSWGNHLARSCPGVVTACSSFAYPKFLQHIVGVHLDSAHVELDRADVLVDFAFVGHG